MRLTNMAMAGAALFALSACQDIKAADELRAEVVSEQQYLHLGCPQLGQLLQAGQRELGEAEDDLDDAATSARWVQAGVWLLFPIGPIANPFLPGNKNEQADYEEAAGDYNAIVKAGRARGCWA